MAFASTRVIAVPPLVRLHEGPPPREDLDAVAAVLRSGWLTMGPRTLELEAACAAQAGAAHAVACAGDGAALALVLLGLGVGPGHRVVIPGACGATAARAVRRCRAEPVVAEVVSAADPTLDAEDALARADGATAIVAVHPLGARARVADLAEACARRGVALVEHAPAGPCGPPAGLALVHGLLPGGVGEGAAVAVALVGDDALAGFVRTRRSHAMTAGTWARHTGRSDSYDVVGLGFNHRVDEIRSVLARRRLDREDAAAPRRAALAAAYRQGLAGARGITPAEGDDEGRHAFAVVLADPSRRGTLASALAARGIA